LKLRNQLPQTQKDTVFFWIVPNQEYTVQIDFDQDETPDCLTTIGDGDDFESPQPGKLVDIGTCS